MPRVQLPAVTPKSRAWNKGRLIGQKRPLLPKQVWAIRTRLEIAGNLRDLALFNVAIDSKLRGCDLVRLKVVDLVTADRVRERASVIQSKTNRPVQFELTENTRESVVNWVFMPEMIGCVSCFRAGYMTARTSQRANMGDWCETGSLLLDWSLADMVHIRCAEQRRLRSTAKLEICAPYNYCLVTPRSTAQCVTWASNLKMR